MHRYLLNLLYAALLVLATPWLLFQAITRNKYRHGWREKLLGVSQARNGSTPCIWFHAVSVGEMNLLAPLIERLQQHAPDTTILLSATTQTGFDLAARKYPHLQCVWFPMDFTWAVRRTIAKLNPTMLVLSELEIWPNLVARCRTEGVNVGVINGRLSENSFRGYMRFRRLLRPVFASLDFVFAQSELYAQRFIEMGVRSEVVSVSGSIKFDGAETDRENTRTVTLAAMAGFATDDVVFLAGSTQDPEEEYSVEAFRQLHKSNPNLRLVIVPRHPERFDAVANILDRSGFCWQRRSELESRTAANSHARILLVDTIGELGAWWGTAHIAFVGGSFGNRGGQNMIEPAAYGAAVSFGPNTKNFREIVELLLTNNASVRVDSPDALTNFVAACLRDDEFRDSLGQRARRLVASQQGAADVTATLLVGFLTNQSLKIVSHSDEPDGADRKECA